MNITKTLAKQVIDKMVNYATKSKIDDARALFGQALYEWYMSDPKRAAIPKTFVTDRWVGTSDSIYVDYSLVTEADVQYSERNIQFPHRVPTKIHEHFCYSETVHARAPLFVQNAFTEWRNALYGAWGIRKDLEEVFAACRSSTTLLKILPEAKDFLPDAPTGGALVPVAPVERLREAFKKA